MSSTAVVVTRPEGPEGSVASFGVPVGWRRGRVRPGGGPDLVQVLGVQEVVLQRHVVQVAVAQQLLAEDGRLGAVRRPLGVDQPRPGQARHGPSSWTLVWGAKACPP